MIIGAMLVSSMLFAQNIKPTLEANGNKVKATYFYDNGLVQQQGFYKDGKLEGQWISYDTTGNKKAIGNYSQGQKTGKWFFWNKAVLSEVDYVNSTIALVTNWKQDAIVNVN